MLEIDNIIKNFDEVHALRGISLSVEENEIFGLIGPDGSGKTTLFRIIATLLLPDSGKVSMLGYDVVRYYKKIRKLIGYMAGRFSLYYDLSVEENLNFYATVFGTTIRENYDLIRDIYSHIEPFKRRLAGNLSGGMKQKLALSCALIHKPRFLILDEPTTGVDAVSRKEFWDMLRKLREKEITIIVSTPYMDEARLCDRVALIQNGSILSLDKPERIIRMYSKDLFAARSDKLYKLVMDLRAYTEISSAFLFGHNVHFNIIDSKSYLENLRKYLENKGHRDIKISKIEPGIEDCFVALMGEEKENNLK
jgi:ABC-2 type transport system ATP-binding protein